MTVAARERTGVPGRQDGAALVVALILVLVSTLLGVSVMESSTIEVQLANNEEFRESVFRTAEAASEAALDTLDVTTVLAAGGSATPAIDSIDSRVAVSTEQRIEGLAHVVGSSFGTFQNYLVSSSATARVDALGARRTVTQGESIRALAGGR